MEEEVKRLNEKKDLKCRFSIKPNNLLQGHIQVQISFFQGLQLISLPTIIVPLPFPPLSFAGLTQPKTSNGVVKR